MSTAPDPSASTGAPDPDAAPDPDLEADPDGDPEMLNPRDLRGVQTGDGALDDGETDADPGTLNPRDG